MSITYYSLLKNIFALSKSMIMPIESLIASFIDLDLINSARRKFFVTRTLS